MMEILIRGEKCNDIKLAESLEDITVTLDGVKLSSLAACVFLVTGQIYRRI